MPEWGTLFGFRKVCCMKLTAEERPKYSGVVPMSRSASAAAIAPIALTWLSGCIDSRALREAPVGMRSERE